MKGRYVTPGRASTAAMLSTTVRSRTRVPPLPEIGSPWHERTVRWWGVLSKSPMRNEWLDVDIEGLTILAVLIDMFWKEPTPTLAAEIRQQASLFGLNPTSRLRLAWSTESVATPPPRGSGLVKSAADDPRRHLQPVN